ncbi:(2Fe-2S)-binding protein [Spirosoma taeanense]|uniref:(2Fe-2S)-binding protein n=1 Tax=Spirosoma taeanense TaxID=2735870 RepID=A0A6M5YCY9_9BACT|nr:2Fe-2S iron-sulfur cluster-binding protein [Spirosoma taeanense]QJW90822.1 (2Fe-2S)-binding protein [Spirosoma taeanense]
MIQFTVEDRDGTRQMLDVPEGFSLSLMEVLKGSNYTVLATCGGMALCATCHVQVLAGLDSLPPAQDAELDMLDTLPDSDFDSRLSCQIRVDERLEGGIFRIKGAEQ